MQQARTVVATGTALPFPLWRRESGLFPHSPRSGITKKGLVGFKPQVRRLRNPVSSQSKQPANRGGLRFVRDGSRGLVAASAALASVPRE
jgi:hypothetical protein